MQTFADDPRGGPRRRPIRRPALAWGLAGVLFLLAGAPTAEAKGLPGKWQEIRSPNFIVITNAGDRQARETAEHFEQIHDLFIEFFPGMALEPTAPLPVFALRDERTMKRFLPEYWEKRGGTRPAGLFRTVPNPLIVMRTDLVGGENFGLVYHEYFHYLTRETTEMQLPTWVSEGLAEFWEGTRLTPRSTEVGLPIQYHLALLRQGGMLPLEELARVDQSSPYYTESLKTNLFYAQSWALTHYLQLGEPTGEGMQKLRRYLFRVGKGMESGQAMAEAFGDLEKLSFDLRTYIGSYQIPIGKLPPLKKLAEDQLQIRKVTSAEANARGARFLFEKGQNAAAEELVVAALEGDPKLAIVQETAGLFYYVKGDYPKAAVALGKALELGSGDPVIPFSLGVSLYQNATSPEELATVEGHLEAALAANPDYAPAHARLAELYRKADPAPDRALEYIQRAVDLSPNSNTYFLKQLQILWNHGQKESAERALKDLVARSMASGNARWNNAVCWDGALMGFGALVMPACEKAVELKPESFGYLDSRGVARAAAGNLEGALTDLRRACELGAEDWSSEDLARRRGWIKQLEAGSNPLEGEALVELHDDPDEGVFGRFE
ncbi:MAG: tetratricopeptide repeat protein [Acidobacteriota bacterium]